MRLVYIDEAGISNPQQEPFLVVAGVIIHADRNLIEVERYLDKLVARYIPPERQAAFVFHAHELFNGGGKVFKRDDARFPLAARLEIADQLANIPKKFGLVMAFGFVKRANFPIHRFPGFDALSARDKGAAQHVTAFMTAAMQIDHWMRKNAPSEVCMLVVEDNDQARKLIRETQSYHQRTEFFEPEIALHFPFRKIKEDPLFQNKRRSSVLQVADFFAYVFKRHLMEDARYQRFIDPIIGRMAFLDGERSSRKQQN